MEWFLFGKKQVNLIHKMKNELLIPEIRASLNSHQKKNENVRTWSERGETTGSKIMFSCFLFKCSEWIPAFTTRVDQTNGSTLVKLILFEKSRVELEFVF